jgi:hypothetical protein
MMSANDQSEKCSGNPVILVLFIDGTVDHNERVALFAYFATQLDGCSSRNRF